LRFTLQLRFRKDTLHLFQDVFPLPRLELGVLERRKQYGIDNKKRRALSPSLFSLSEAIKQVDRLGFQVLAFATTGRPLADRR